MLRRSRDMAGPATMIVAAVLLTAYPHCRYTSIGVAAAMSVLVSIAVRGYVVTVSPRGDLALLIASAGGPLAMLIMIVPTADHSHMAHHAAMPMSTLHAVLVLCLLATAAAASQCHHGRAVTRWVGDVVMCVGMAVPVVSML